MDELDQLFSDLNPTEAREVAGEVRAALLDIAKRRKEAKAGGGQPPAPSTNERNRLQSYLQTLEDDDLAAAQAELTAHSSDNGLRAVAEAGVQKARANKQEALRLEYRAKMLAAKGKPQEITRIMETYKAAGVPIWNEDFS